MVVFGAYTARARAAKVPGVLGPLLITLSTAALITLEIVLALDIFEPTPQYLVPVGGMVIGNAMTAAAVALNRLGDDVTSSARQIEATLALGASSAEAAAPIVRQPALRDDRPGGLDQDHRPDLLPGTMVGMLLAGADPIDAVRLRLILLWVLLGSVAISSVVATGLAYRGFFARPPAPRAAGPVARGSITTFSARDTHLQRHPAHRAQAPRQLHRRDPPVRGRPGPGRVDLRGRSARPHSGLRPGRSARAPSTTRPRSCSQQGSTPTAASSSGSPTSMSTPS